MTFSNSAISILAIAASGLSFVAGCGDTLLKQTFDGNGTDTWRVLDFAAAKSYFGGIVRYSKHGNTRVEVGDGKLKVKHPKGVVGTNRGGVVLAAVLSEEVEEATLSYKVKFDSGYHWTAGGKLPGLCDIDCPTGCTSTNKNSTGWSSRLMWRDNGEMESYMYYPFKIWNGTCGEEWSTPAKFSGGQWHTIVLYIKLNDPATSDGLQTVWLDGQQILDKNDVRFRREGGHRIATLKFDNFHGGTSKSFAPSKTQFVEFDDIHIQKGRCAP